ncbi:MerR family transcriptional regulator [Virgibacillus salidurans]|uniref:MerR family transcriptional regulator n=1 Tax=Virgibacillus salidurans TaxID=2831673 RepID=UPI001F16AF5F|nr:MerR family transcriptional regulator [Virgibacillus sp. NKC19-16]
MYTISEFGMKTGISTRTLRFYEEIELLYPSERNTSGHRLYGLSELATLQQIQSLKFIGYSLQEIKNFLEEKGASMDHLESSLPLQKKLLMEKRDELNRAIDSIDYVQGLLKEGHSMTWRHLSSLLQSIECEEDQKEWMKEYFSEEFAQQYFDLTKEQRQELDKDWMLILADVKKLIKEQRASTCS